MQVTERDKELLLTILRFGFLLVEQVGRLWAVADFSTVAARVRKLVEAGLVERVVLPHFSARPLLLTKAGLALIDANMQPLRGIRTSTFAHDCMIFELAMSLERKFPGSSFETEREYRCRYPDRGHTPDGVLCQPNGSRTAIELELSQKPPKRLGAIINSYAATLDLDEVWYVVRTEAMRTFVRRIAGDAPHLKVVLWSLKTDRPSETSEGNHSHREVRP